MPSQLDKISEQFRKDNLKEMIIKVIKHTIQSPTISDGDE